MSKLLRKTYGNVESLDNEKIGTVVVASIMIRDNVLNEYIDEGSWAYLKISETEWRYVDPEPYEGSRYVGKLTYTAQTIMSYSVVVKKIGTWPLKYVTIPKRICELGQP